MGDSRNACLLLSAAWVAAFLFAVSLAHAEPAPLLSKDRAVNWWFVFKFNSKSFPACSGAADRTCPFGGKLQDYKNFSQQFVYASSEDPRGLGKTTKLERREASCRIRTM